MGMDCNIVQDKIVAWLKNQLDKSGQNGFVVGVSGGIDSAVVSTLCALTGRPTLVVSLPIHPMIGKPDLGRDHIGWLLQTYPNVSFSGTDLSYVLDRFENDLWEPVFRYNEHGDEELHDLVSANLRSRLRMCALYAYANASRFLVVGTGNKIEDYGIGFCTKGGDNLIDMSPIGDLLKSEVRELGKHLGVLDSIVKASPTDGLWADGRTDEDQIGCNYEELEWAMSIYDMKIPIGSLTERQREVLAIYATRHLSNRHKMLLPPICYI
jgi:NAD+ synthase